MSQDQTPQFLGEKPTQKERDTIMYIKLALESKLFGIQFCNVPLDYKSRAGWS